MPRFALNLTLAFANLPLHGRIAAAAQAGIRRVEMLFPYDLPAGDIAAQLRATGLRIVPLCPYVQAQYRRHPEWADVFTSAPGEKPRLRM